jgi:hypothetical protein
VERLVLPRALGTFVKWLQQIGRIDGMQWLVPAHYSAPIVFNPQRCNELCSQLDAETWAPSEANWAFLSSIDQRLLDLGVVPTDPVLKG